PKNLQTLFFSATLPPPIVALAGDMLNNPVSINIMPTPTPAAEISHVAYPVAHELKSTLFLALLNKSLPKSVLAFTRTKHRANWLADFLEKNGVSCARIHGNRSQNQRTEALAGFKKGRFRVLVATDIAARGIDVEAIGLVCNFDVPPLAEDYVHRVGRTGRAGAKGDAYTLVSPDEEKTFRTIEYSLGRQMPRETVPDFNYQKKPSERFEIPVNERIASIRERRTRERNRRNEKGEMKGRRQSRPEGQFAEKGIQAGLAPKACRNSTIFGFSKEKAPALRRFSEISTSKKLQKGV
ncbi:MAG: DEAD/DEAH box helicase, partial [Thermodesulfobacteriota bacterium]